MELRYIENLHIFTSFTRSDFGACSGVLIRAGLIHTHTAPGVAAAPVFTGPIKLVVLREAFHTHAAAAAAEN